MIQSINKANNISIRIYRIDCNIKELHIIILNIKLAINNTAVKALSTWIRGVIKSLRGKKPRRNKSNSGLLTYCHTFLDSRLISQGVLWHRSTCALPVYYMLAFYFIASLYSVCVVVVYIGFRILFGSRKKSRECSSSNTLSQGSSITLIQVLL